MRFRTRAHLLQWAIGLLGLLSFTPSIKADEPPEYRLKTAILYSFAVYTEWPPEVGSTLNLCLVGKDMFGPEIDALQGQTVGRRSIVVHRVVGGDALNDCQILFITPSAMAGLPHVLDGLRGRPVLTVADSPDALRQGVALNMLVSQSRISFEVNLKAARGAGLNFSSKLLRLAKEILQ